MTTGATGTCARPIFILGLLGRSGTNHVSDLLRLHPDVALPSPIWEDHLVRFGGHLERYVDDLERFFSRTHPEWGVDDGFGADLLAGIGRGLVDVLAQHAGDGVRPLTKTPSVEHLDLFFELFPDADLVIVVRDGPETVESLVRSFDWSHERAMHAWASGARTIARFEQRAAGTDARYRLVRYENLLADLDGELDRLLEFLGLDPSTYDRAAAHALPVRGSSTVRVADRPVHWEPLAKDSSFDPLGRAQHWSRAQRARFDWIAGDARAAIGYGTTAPASRPAWLAQAARDLAWRAGSSTVGAARGLRQRAAARRETTERGRRASRSIARRAHARTSIAATDRP